MHTNRTMIQPTDLGTIQQSTIATATAAKHPWNTTHNCGRCQRQRRWRRQASQVRIYYDFACFCFIFSHVPPQTQTNQHCNLHSTTEPFQLLSLCHLSPRHLCNSPYASKHQLHRLIVACVWLILFSVDTKIYAPVVYLLFNSHRTNGWRGWNKTSPR